MHNLFCVPVTLEDGTVLPRCALGLGCILLIVFLYFPEMNLKARALAQRRQVDHPRDRQNLWCGARPHPSDRHRTLINIEQNN